MNAHIINKYSPDYQLDTSGLNCPLPLLKLKQQLNSASTGDRIYLVATDPHSEVDIGRFCERAGHGLVNIHTEQFVQTAEKTSINKTKDDTDQNQLDSFHFIITKLVTKSS